MKTLDKEHLDRVYKPPLTSNLIILCQAQSLYKAMTQVLHYDMAPSDDSFNNPKLLDLEHYRP